MELGLLPKIQVLLHRIDFIPTNGVQTTQYDNHYYESFPLSRPFTAIAKTQFKHTPSSAGKSPANPIPRLFISDKTHTRWDCIHTGRQARKRLRTYDTEVTP